MPRRTVVDPRFAARLRELRIERGLSLQNLAAVAHVGKSTISELENSLKTPMVPTAEALDRALEAGGELARMVTEVVEGLPHRRSSGTDTSGVPMLAMEMRVAVDGVATALTGHGIRDRQKAVTEQEVTAAAARAKLHYQAGRYSQVVEELPALLGMVRAVAEMETSSGSRTQVLAADAYQTACSVLLKFGDVALATLAADRSMAAAFRSGDPIAIAASTRALVHALASSGHRERAATLALEAARRLDRAGGLSTTVGLAVYGALLLRASVVAAASEDRSTAVEALTEARDTAVRLGGEDDNAHWTYFCPINVQLHQVSVATSLGDAGQAIAHARQISPSVIMLAERKACLYIDVARAYTLWGKYDKAYEALRMAEQAAPQEVSVRPLVHDVVGELQRRCPASVYGRVSQLAQRIGALR